MMNAVVLAACLICAPVSIKCCGPVKPNHQFCVTATLEQFPVDYHTAMGIHDPNSEDYRVMKHLVLIELNRIVDAKHWKNRVNPPPQFCRFENSTAGGQEIDALVNVWANADAADIQKQLNPAELKLSPPPLYPIGKIVATAGPCPTFGNATRICHP